MIVGLCGAAGSGKDSAAKALIQHAGYHKKSFAWPIKEALDRMFGWVPHWESLAWKETPRPEAHGKTPRQLAQTLGTDWGRKMVSPDIWVDIAIAEAKQDEVYGNIAVFTDVRFPNEAAAIRGAGGVLIYVTCTDRESGTTSNQHESERWLPWLWLYADAEIAAAFGQIEHLQEAALNVVENYRRGYAPRFEPNAETLAKLSEIERSITNV